HAGAGGDDGEDQEERGHRVRRRDHVDVRARHARDLVGDRRVDEPDAEHQTQQTRRRQLGDVGQPHRRHAQLAHRVQQIGQAQEHHADLRRLRARLDARRAVRQRREAQTQQHQTHAELHRTARVPVTLPQLAEHGRQDHQEEGVQHAEPGGRNLRLLQRELASQHPQRQAPDRRQRQRQQAVGRRVLARRAARQLHQQPAQDRHRDQRHQRVGDLEHQTARAHQRPVRVVRREDGHRSAGLLEREPEEDREEREHQDRDQAVTHDVRGRVVQRLAVVHQRRVLARRPADAAEDALAQPELQRAQDHEDRGQAEAVVPADLLAD
ncbi:conserved hypothetical protein, partial [Ricinus communis]